MIRKWRRSPRSGASRGSPTSRTVFRATCAARPTGREYPNAAVPFGDRWLPYAALYDLQAGQGEGLNILKGSGSFPVFFWKLYIRHKETRKKIEQAEYYRLPQEQRRQYDELPRDALLPGFQHRPDGYVGTAAGALRFAYDTGRTERLLGRSDMRTPRPDAGGAVVALSHPAQIRQQGVLFADARPDRLPRKTAVSGECGLLDHASSRGHLS